MKLHFSTAVVCITLFLGACAKRPDAITPVAIPASAYSNMGCKELTTAMISERTNLNALSSAQNSAATGDAFGVFLIGVPLGSVSGGDKEGLIAVSKGKITAMEGELLRQRC